MNIPKILLVEDNFSLRLMSRRFFEKNGFEVIEAGDGEAAIRIEEEEKPDIVILDIDIPKINGFDVCKEIRKKRSGINYIPIVFVSGNIEERSIIKGLQIGADDYVRKPFELIELLNRINNLLKMKNFIAKLESLENVIFSLVKSIEARDFYTAGHSRRVANVSVNISRKLGVSDEEQEMLYKGSLLHDIGKLGIPDQILNKAGKLITDEFDRIKEHPERGQDICGNLRVDPKIIDIIHHHHEKLDGSGYPDKLKGDQLTVLVRIVAVADIFDALTTKRPYREAKSNEEALEIIKKESNEGKLDQKVVDALEVLIRAKKVKEDVDPE